MFLDIEAYAGQDDDFTINLVAIYPSEITVYDPTPITRFRLVLDSGRVLDSQSVAGLFTWPVDAEDEAGNACKAVRIRPGAASLPAGVHEGRLVGIQTGYSSGRTWGSLRIRVIP